jgi:diguanylate cyclase (GGDEF)-like protein/PAS domain S-box-containing protein
MGCGILMKIKELNAEKVNYTESIFRQLSNEIKFILDESNMISYISDNVANILGFESNEMIGMNILKFIEPNEKFININVQSVNNMHVSFICRNGEKIHMELQMKYIKDNENCIERYGTMINISKYERIKNREEKLNIVLDNAKDIIYTFQIVPEPKFVYISPAIEKVLGYEVEKYYADYVHIFNTSHPEDVFILHKKMNNELDYSKPIVSRWIHKKGHCVWVEDYVTPTYDNEGNLIAFEGVCRDISERKALEDKLNYLTYHDSLTGLKNRTFYDMQIEELDIRINLPVGIIVCDLDNLKIVNDTMGHEKGDVMIKSASELLAKLINDNMSISRIGGDEFVVLVRKIDELGIIELCKKIELLIGNYNKENKEFPIEISIGHAFCENSVGNMNNIFKIADKNMYANKLNKRRVKYV